ncbi:MAG: HAD-IB family phosphatase, partial [Bacteroidales bacterium]
MPLEDFSSLCFSFNKDELNKLIYPAALASIEEYRKAGDRVLIITASAENWVKPWCDACQVECIGSKLETKDGKLTGRLLGKNCYGEEKVRRLLEVADPKMYDEFIVYGDSRGDYALGQIATRFFYRQFS